MAVESRRGCGYRKVGGLYMVGGGLSQPCDRLPIALHVCPTCSQGIKQSRGWTYIDVAKLIGGQHIPCEDGAFCPLCDDPSKIGKAGLLWVGERFYPTTQDFMREEKELGISRRLSAVPRGFELGKTWVLFAHPKAITEVVTEGENGNEKIKTKFTPGIFRVWLPTRLERIFKESDRNSEKVAADEKRGITPVFVPDNDPDHQGTVYDKSESEEE